MSTYDPFVLPFAAGVVFILFAFILKLYKWLSSIDKADRRKIFKGFFSFKFFFATWEVIRESLLHFKIFKQNPVLGFMHFSLAFGWFMLIAIGNLESRIHAGTDINPYWFPIFFDFFVTDKSSIPFEFVFSFFMDFFLLLVLIGVLMASIKRFSPALFGMKKTTKLRFGDSVALYSLWLIFPLRLFAESFTAGIYNSGSFLTSPIGEHASILFDLEQPAYVSWWAYSFALGAFFFALPFSRYLHIPAEVVLIYFRKFGVSSYNKFNGFTELEIDSCSRCGVCIDKCQINFVTNNTSVAPSYFIRNLRYDKPDAVQIHSCLLCGRCQDACPVGIDINNIRIAVRNNYNGYHKTSFSYLPELNINKADVAYFAGCMTHLTPSIIVAMKQIFNASGTKWIFIDEKGGACCGRPLKIAGELEAAVSLMNFNKSLIEKSGAKVLVTSCPICLKVFKDDYNLNVKVLHHSQYINNLMIEGKLNLQKSDSVKMVYHDPCELGRGLKIYDAPRNVLNNFGQLIEATNSKNKSLCCGGSLGNTFTSDKEREKIALDAYMHLTSSSPDLLVTACPLCKKTFKRFGNNNVKDIAELVFEQLQCEVRDVSNESRNHL